MTRDKTRENRDENTETETREEKRKKNAEKRKEKRRSRHCRDRKREEIGIIKRLRDGSVPNDRKKKR